MSAREYASVVLVTVAVLVLVPLYIVATFALSRRLGSWLAERCTGGET